jgi:hypothetical protein
MLRRRQLALVHEQEYPLVDLDTVQTSIELTWLYNLLLRLAIRPYSCVLRSFLALLGFSVKEGEVM